MLSALFSKVSDSDCMDISRVIPIFSLLGLLYGCLIDFLNFLLLISETRGDDAVQTIDMNQDNYFEEALKMRNLLEEFKTCYGIRKPTILGVRENIFTGSVSSLAWFMSAQETSFVTLGQRVLANPLKVRMHYGHPDEYIQVGKGRDVGLNQISMFEAKVASGNGEQILSRVVYRLGHRLDFFRMLSFFFSTVGFFFNTMMVVVMVYAFLWGRLYLALSGVEAATISIL